MTTTHTTPIKIVANRITFTFAPIATATVTLTTKQAEAAKENRCTHVLRIDGRRPIALVEEGETAGYVVHTLGATNGHGAGDPGSTTLGLTPIVSTAMVVAPKPAAPVPQTTPNHRRPIAPPATPAPAPPTVVVVPLPAAPIVPAPARRVPTQPVKWAAGDRVRLTETCIAAGHEDRRGECATVRRCAPSQTRPGEYSVRIVWDNRRGGEQPWWAGHFEAAPSMDLALDENDDDAADDDES